MAWPIRPCLGSPDQARRSRLPTWYRRSSVLPSYWPRTKLWRRSFTANSRNFSLTTPSSISFLTTTTTSQKPMCHRAICSSRRTHRSMSISNRCACLRPRHFLSVATRSLLQLSHQYMVSVTRSSTTKWSCI